MAGQRFVFKRFSMNYRRGETDLSRFSRRMHVQSISESDAPRTYPHSDIPRAYRWLGVPFASISVLVILVTLFLMSMERGGWTWSSWTYAFSFAIVVPLILLELKRKAVITGGAIFLLFFMVLIDAGMPGYLGYSPSDLNWYDNLAHYLGAVGLTMFLWSFICWTVSPTGPPKTNGRRKFYAAVLIMVVVSIFFEFTEFFTDAIFGWSNFHPGVDTIGDLIFDLSGIFSAAVVIARHRVSILKRPFWHGTPHPA